jgi:hypothetical protein
MDEEHSENDDADEHTWPAALVNAGAVRAWIAAALPGQPQVLGPLLVQQAKEWGVTASFACADAAPEESREVVFKACLLPLFARAPHIYTLLSEHCAGSVPELLAWTAPRAGQTWALFAPFEGERVEAIHTREALLEMARTLAGIQVTVAGLPAEEKAELPCMPVERVPQWYEAVVHDLRERQASLWRGAGRELAEQLHIPADAVERLEVYRPQVAAWAAELQAAGIPDAIDHVDLQWDNAVRQPDGRMLLFDWEEATLSCPLFSLDRLLNDARELDLGEEAAWAGDADGTLYTLGEAALRDAYLDALPWGTRMARERAFDLAMCLAPVKTAYESMVFADALGWGGEPSLAAAWSVSRMLARWPALRSA